MQHQKRTFRRPGHQLHQTVGLDPTATTTTATATATSAAIVLGVLRCSFLPVSRLGDARCWCGGQGGRGWGAGGEAGGSGQRQGEGRGSPARHVCDAFILKLLQVKLNDFFSLRGEKECSKIRTWGLSTHFESF